MRKVTLVMGQNIKYNKRKQFLHSQETTISSGFFYTKNNPRKERRYSNARSKKKNKGV